MGDTMMIYEPQRMSPHGRTVELEKLREGLKAEQYQLELAKSKLPEWQKRAERDPRKGGEGFDALETQIEGLTEGVASHKRSIADFEAWMKRESEREAREAEMAASARR